MSTTNGTLLWKQDSRSESNWGVIFRNRQEWGQPASPAALERQGRGEHVTLTIVVSIIMFFSIFNNVVAIVPRCFKIKGRERLYSGYGIWLYLAVADFLVGSTFLPTEVTGKRPAYRYKELKEARKDMGCMNMGDQSEGNSWGAGDGVWKLVAFIGSFALHLKGFLTAAVTLDRFTAVVRPLNVCKAIQRARRLSLAAWVGSTTCSIIEAIVYHVEGRAHSSWLKKCSNMDPFSTWEMQLADAAAEQVLSFGFPLATIMICYPWMSWKIWRMSGGLPRTCGANTAIRAGRRALHVSVGLALIFGMCWAPYNILTFWRHLDPRLNFKVKPDTEKILLLLAYSNAALNPILFTCLDAT